MKIRRHRHIIFFLLLIVPWIFGKPPMYAQDSLSYSLFLLGDAGQVNPAQARVFDVLRAQSQITGEKSTILFLGDNIYPIGMPNKDVTGRQVAQDQIDAQLNVVTDHRGSYYFIPGNHGWNNGNEGRLEFIKNQENYIENIAKENVFLPDNGCPGPALINISDNIALIIIDSQWILQKINEPDSEEADCLSDGPVELFQLLGDMLEQNKNKQLIVAMHHPMFSYGNHGSYNTLKDHLFPLTQIAKPLFIPLPGIGSISTWLRSAMANEQDLAHPKYKDVRDALVTVFEQYPNLIHVAGHDHLLEYIKKNDVNYIVSGTVSKVSGMANAAPTEFARAVHGFARLNFYTNGKTAVEFWRVDADNPSGVIAFKKTLISGIPNASLREKPALRENKTDFSDSLMITHASDQYKTLSKFKIRMLGENYRAEWVSQVVAPVFDIGREHGGLTIVQRGGGMQTKSLRLEAANGRQYTLRSIEKYSENAVPEFLRQTFAADLVQDQISSSHPYGALVVPALADAAGIYHTNPRVVYIPDDPRFGPHTESFANSLALYEERPDDDWSDATFFGHSKKIVSTTKVIEKLADDNDNIIDQKFVLTSRLFDLLIGDWDRHDDQWRWASFLTEDGKGKIYRPIPRDRDQAFFVNEGVIPSIVSRKWALPKLEGFDYDVRWPSGLMFNARYFDRSFLTGLSKEDWISAAESLQQKMTDESIVNAFRQWPDEIYRLHGKEIVDKLKSRRDNLREYAIDHYLYLARAVDVVGSNRAEHFKVERRPDGNVLVRVRKMQKDGDKKQVLFERLFQLSETREIRLYGLGGNDEFEVEGASPKGIKVRVVGGDGQDELDDDSHVKGWSRKNIFYDSDTGNILKLNDESRSRLSNSPTVNVYDRKAFKYNVLMPVVTANINPDDGLFVGGGFIFTDHGFRKQPFRSRHSLLASYAIKTSSFDFTYEGDFTAVFGQWNLNTKLDIKRPNFVNNFFGLGNESQFDKKIDDQFNLRKPIDYYRLRFQEISSEVGLSRTVGVHSVFSFSHIFQSVEIVDTENKSRFINDFNDKTGKDIIDVYRNYTGARLNLTIDKRDNKIFTRSGATWDNNLTVLTGVQGSNNTFFSYASALAVYYTFKLPLPLTLGTRIGGGINFGEYEFYQSQILDGKSELRGFRKTRFYGDSKLYHNIELRLKLATFRTYIFPASVGIMAFNDVGRVWLEEENSNLWHHGFGGGVWLSPFNQAILSAEIGHSVEETLLYVRMGFLF